MHLARKTDFGIQLRESNKLVRDHISVHEFRADQSRHQKQLASQ